MVLTKAGHACPAFVRTIQTEKKLTEHNSYPEACNLLICCRCADAHCEQLTEAEVLLSRHTNARPGKPSFVLSSGGRRCGNAPGKNVCWSAGLVRNRILLPKQKIGELSAPIVFRFWISSSEGIGRIKRELRWISACRQTQTNTHIET